MTYSDTARSEIEDALERGYGAIAALAMDARHHPDTEVRRLLLKYYKESLDVVDAAMAHVKELGPV